MRIFINIYTHMDKKGFLLTLYDQLHHGFSRLHVEAVILAGLAAVRARHLPGHINNTQHAVVALHLHAAIRHGCLFISSRPQDDGLGLPWNKALQLHCVTLAGHQGGLAPGDCQVGGN